jgi:polysaccharide biosynthesis transport protein
MQNSSEPYPDSNLPGRVPLWLASRAGERALYPYPTQENSEVRTYWAVIYRRRHVIAGMLLGSLLFTIILILHTKWTYTATTTILVEPQTPQILDMKELESGEAPGIYEHDYYETEYDILKSRSLAAQVIHQLDLMNNPFFWEPDRHQLERDRHPASKSDKRFASAVTLSHMPGQPIGPAEMPAAESEVPPAVINKYLNGLDVQPKIGTRLITIFYTASDPGLAARIANAHVEAYITRGMELHSAASREAEAFLQKKLIELKSQVEQSEIALNTYRRDHGIVSPTLGDEGNDEGNKVVLQRLTDLNADLNKSEEEKIYLESEHQQIRHGDYESLPEVIRSPLIQGLKEEVAKLADQYASMRNRFNSGYHPLDDLKAELDESKTRLHREIQVLVEGVESNYKIQSVRADELRVQIKKITNDAMARNDASLHDAVLVRQVETNRELYQNVLRRMAEINVTANRPSSNVSILDGAEPPSSLSSPKITLDLAKGALFGLLGGLGLSFLLEYFDDSLKSREEAEQYLRIPTLGQIPDFAKVTRAGHALKHYLRRGAAVLQTDQELRIDEAFRVIRNTILFGWSNGTPRTVLVTSAVSGEGKTVTAINTAVAFAHLTGRTLLIDADLRRPRCHEFLQLSNEAGLSERLYGQKQTYAVIQPTRFEGLFLLSAGAEVSRPGELLASPRMRELLSELKQKFDYILLDSAPLAPVSDTEGLARLVDAAMVVANSTSSKQLVQAACSRLELVGAKLFGVVLNRVDLGPERYAYSYRRPGREEKQPN